MLWNALRQKGSVKDMEVLQEQSSVKESVGQMETSQESIDKMLERMNKQLFYTRILAVAALGLFLVFFLSAVIVVPRVCGTLKQVNSLAENATGTLDAANQALSEVSKMSGEITGVSTQLSEFITENAQTLSDAATDISEIDFEGLNQAIQDLQDAVGPFANLMNSFRR